MYDFEATQKEHQSDESWWLPLRRPDSMPPKKGIKTMTNFAAELGTAANR
jgi:hypothetical protein